MAIRYNILNYHIGSDPETGFKKAGKHMKKRSKGHVVFWALLVFLVFLCGCGNDAPWESWTEERTLIQKDGQVTCCIIDGFEKDYYDLDELRQMAVEETSHFNGEYKQNGGSAAVLEVARLDEAQNMVRVTYRFSGGDVYTAFFTEKLYFETVGEALEAKHLFTGIDLYNETGSIKMDEDNKEKLKGRHVIVTDAKSIIEVPYEVEYYSYGVTIRKDGSVDTLGCSGTATIILKK